MLNSCIGELLKTGYVKYTMKENRSVQLQCWLVLTFMIVMGCEKGIDIQSGLQVGIVGNSTAAAFKGQNSIAHYMGEYSITDISHPGDNINMQLSKWSALSVERKRLLDYVFVEIGLNDLGGVGVDSTGSWKAYDRYQNLLNTIRSEVQVGCKIITCTLTPAAAGVSLVNWTNFNEAVKGLGDNAINNFDDNCFEQTDELNDGTGHLKAKYDIGDGVHENNLAREFIAAVWKSKIALE
jgi:hypothetical protein